MAGMMETGRKEKSRKEKYRRKGGKISKEKISNRKTQKRKMSKRKEIIVMRGRLIEIVKQCFCGWFDSSDMFILIMMTMNTDEYNEYLLFITHRYRFIYAYFRRGCRILPSKIQNSIRNSRIQKSRKNSVRILYTPAEFKGKKYMSLKF